MNEIIEMDEPALQLATPRNTAVAVTTPASLLQIAVQRGASIDELTKLMDLQERFEKREAEKSFTEAMAAFKLNPPTILKEKLVSFKDTSYYHATHSAVTEAIIAGLAAHGVSHRWDLDQKDGKVGVTCVLTHRAGHSQSTRLESVSDQSGGKNSIQAIMSAKTYLERHTLLAATGLSTKDMDGSDDDGRGADKKKGKEPEKFTINGVRFANAITQVVAGTYPAAKLRAGFALTVDQETALSDAEKEIK